MTREIKFRAWDEKLGMSDAFTLKDAVNSDVDEYDVFMQYTGLKDKNGKEIYEGDIAWDENYEEYCKVEFKEGCFRYTNGTVTQELFERCDQLEIVGNIYENTELLKEQTQ